MKPLIRVLGRDANHVGDLFELLMKEVLAQQGFGSFVRNAYKTGAEIDLRAAHRVTAQPLLCECKARGRPLDTNAVKIFFAEWAKEHTSDKRLYGIVMSLSGYTGTAKQWHSELDPGTRQQFSILDSDDLLRELVQTNATLQDAAVVELLRRRFDLEMVQEQWLTYSEHGFAWLIKYRTASGDQLYTIVGPKGETLPTWKTASVARLLRRHVRGAEFFGLDVRRKVQLELFNNITRTRSELVTAIGESSPDIVAAAEQLLTEGRLMRSGEGYILNRDIVQFVNVAREFVTTDDAVEFTSSPYAQGVLMQPELIRYIDDRYRLGMEAPEREALTGIMRMSPSALRYALFNDPARSHRTHAHIQEIIVDSDAKSRWLTLHRQSLLQEALFRAIHDLTNEATNLSKHLGSLGIKRFRIASKLVAVGDPWKPLRMQSEHNVALAIAGGTIEAGSLISYSNPAEFHLWDGILNLHAEEFGHATNDFQEALVAAEKAGDVATVNAALNNLALVLMRQKLWEPALEVLARVVNASLDTYTPCTNFVICLMELGRSDEAEQFVSKTIGRFPEAEQSEVIRRFRNGWRSSTA